MRLPVQSAGVPETVNVKVSQLTPSTHVPSPLFVPPAAVPVQETGDEVGVIIPEVGLAARMRRIDNPQVKLINTKTKNNIQRVRFISFPLF